jgi:hypothetical protein
MTLSIRKRRLPNGSTRTPQPLPASLIHPDFSPPSIARLAAQPVNSVRYGILDSYAIT